MTTVPQASRHLDFDDYSLEYIEIPITQKRLMKSMKIWYQKWG